jgi:hypothetical protein
MIEGFGLKIQGLDPSGLAPLVNQFKIAVADFLKLSLLPRKAAGGSFSYRPEGGNH